MKRLIILLWSLALLLSACGNAVVTPPPATPTNLSATVAAVVTPNASGPISIIDVAGRPVTLDALPQRIVSLAPSNTEILFAIGAGSRVVGVDDFTNYPPEATSLPRIGNSGNNYNMEQIVALEPDLVLASGITAPEVIAQLESLNLKVAQVNAPITTFDTIFNDILLTGQITGQTAEAEQLVASMRQHYDSILKTVSQATTKPRVYWEIDATDITKPYSVGPGNFVGEQIGLVGGFNIFNDASTPYPQVSLEQIVAADPEVIILADAAYGITVESVMERPGWDVISAVKNKRIYPINDDLVTRPGPRIVEGLEAVAKLVHPELFE